MPDIILNNRTVCASPGATLLDVARDAGIPIPTLCHRDGLEPLTSCFLCVVRVDGRQSLVPACATRVQDGMRVETDCDDVMEARRVALELLLSDHVGDCMGPCQLICPARMEIPRMIRQIAAGDMVGASATVREEIALPAVLGRICPAPCEKGCRRGHHDAPLGIMRLKRFVADADLSSDSAYVPVPLPDTGKRVAIIGAGPTGLSAAYYLRLKGHSCTVYDQNEQPGGMLRYGVPEQDLPRDILDAEIETIRRTGIDLRLGTAVEGTAMPDICGEYDAVALAVGCASPETLGTFGVKTGKRGIAVNSSTLQSSLANVFAGGDAVRETRMTVTSCAAGKTLSVTIDQFLAGQPVTGRRQKFNSSLGRLLEGEMDEFLKEAADRPRVEPSAPDGGYAEAEAGQEATRCLHCDCRKATRCDLRDHAEEYAAKQRRFRGEQRRSFRQLRQCAGVVYEPGKCVKCGICVSITEKAGEPLGLTFIGRGFDVQVGVPFNDTLDAALTRSAADCVEACPTGALAWLYSGDQS